MDQIFTPKFWQDQWDVVMSAPWLIIPLLLLAAYLGARWRRTVDDGELRGVRAENNALNTQLSAAHREHDVVTKQIADIRPEIDLLKVPKPLSVPPPAPDWKIHPRHVPGRIIVFIAPIHRISRLGGTGGDAAHCVAAL
jgi:hypothetical protein